MYPAQLFHGGDAVNGLVAFTSTGIRFEPALKAGTEKPRAPLEMPAGEITLRFGGHNDEQVFIEPRGQQGVSIHVKDLRFASAFTRQFPGSVAVKPLRKKTHPVLILLISLLLFFVALVLLAISQKDRLVFFAAKKIPLQWEEKLGESVLESLQKEGKIEPESAVKPALDPIISRLLPVVSDSGYLFRFYISNDTNVNAFALPGGFVIVNRGLLKSADNAEEVAGVLAHELAHVTRKHSLRRIIEVLGLHAAFQLVLGDSTGLSAIFVEGSRTLLEQKYSRDFEREADDFGFKYLVSAEVDPQGMVSFFEKLKKMEGKIPDYLSLLNTHPATAERIERLEKKLKEAKEGKQFKPLPALKR
jgi:beta-barrel assembly-enhancing protease